jgi:hypothetical protein
MAYNPNFEQIGNAFVQHYYSKFDVGDSTVRTAGLEGLYGYFLSNFSAFFTLSITDCAL